MDQLFKGVGRGGLIELQLFLFFFRYYLSLLQLFLVDIRRNLLGSWLVGFFNLLVKSSSPRHLGIRSIEFLLLN